jgi:AcrR family transcriptional regulator
MTKIDDHDQRGRAGGMQAARRNTAADGGTGRSPGRPRDTSLDTAILAAAVRQLGERGYAGMSIEGVAAQAGTSAPSLRRRYPGKLALAVAAIDAMPVTPLPRVAAAPRADALAVLENIRDTMVRRDGLAVLGAVLAERDRHRELLAHFQRHVAGPPEDRLREALARGVASGGLPAGLDPGLTVSLLTGSLYACYLRDEPIPADWASRTLGVIWPGPAAGPD